MRSATTSVAPGTSLRMASICKPMRSISLRSPPKIFTPIMARKPDWSMVMRVWIGWSHVGSTPGSAVFCCNSARISCLVIVRSSGASHARGAFSAAGQPENQRSTGTFRHSFSGFRLMMLSIMLIGAGSRALSARPIFPTTVSTSGTLAMARSCLALTSMAGPSPVCGSSDGM